MRFPSSTCWFYPCRSVPSGNQSFGSCLLSRMSQIQSFWLTESFRSLPYVFIDSYLRLYYLCLLHHALPFWDPSGLICRRLRWSSRLASFLRLHLHDFEWISLTNPSCLVWSIYWPYLRYLGSIPIIGNNLVIAWTWSSGHWCFPTHSLRTLLRLQLLGAHFIRLIWLQIFCFRNSLIFGSFQICRFLYWRGHSWFRRFRRSWHSELPKSMRFY